MPPSTMSGAGTVLLAWAKDRSGAKVDVRALDAASRRARAPFSCLGCGEPLVARLGKVRARHFAHRPGSACPLTAPESALHLDAKERLLALCRDAFAGARRVTVLARCPACRGIAPRDLAALGDEAVPEGAVGPLRADVLVRARGRPVLALEVRVTHALDAGKEASLAAAGVPVVEIDAREEWLRAEPGGAAVAPARSLGFPTCEACLARERAEAERAKGGEAAEVAELELYRARGLFGRASSSREGLGAVALRFRCPECGGRDLLRGSAILRHACPGASARPVAWTGFDGETVSLAWWR
ncbi:MAG TPA: competence protein CoiA family protein [Anaeromyxobacter sp.]